MTAPTAVWMGVTPLAVMLTSTSGYKRRRRTVSTFLLLAAVWRSVSPSRILRSMSTHLSS
ncbi:hypothetical protein C7212DRAFT_306715, partial [Tuber magnatum]